MVHVHEDRVLSGYKSQTKSMADMTSLHLDTAAQKIEVFSKVSRDVRG